jgi:hypothetical protein
MNCRRSAEGETSSCWLGLSDRSVVTLLGLSVRGTGGAGRCSSRGILYNWRLRTAVVLVWGKRGKRGFYRRGLTVPQIRMLIAWSRESVGMLGVKRREGLELKERRHQHHSPLTAVTPALPCHVLWARGPSTSSVAVDVKSGTKSSMSLVQVGHSNDLEEQQ